MIHYFNDGAGGFIGIDTSQRVREVPNFLFGKHAATPGDITTIQERIWSPTALTDEVPASEVPDEWITALGLGEDARPRPLRRKRRTSEREEAWPENNPMPEKSFLVPLVPLDEYEAFMADDDNPTDPTDVRFPWETGVGQVVITTVGCVAFVIFGIIVLGF